MNDSKKEQTSSRKNRKYRGYVILALVVGTITLSIAFAALTQALNINGRARIGGGNEWRVEFANLQDAVATGYTIVHTPAVITNGSTAITFDISLHQLGDSVTYLFDVRNAGSIDAKISTINYIGLTEAQSANIHYRITYADNTAINIGDTLVAGETKSLKLVIVLNVRPNTDSPDIELNLGATIDYIQY